MSKLHYCLTGRSVTDQVMLYKNTRDCKDYLPIQIYYDNFKNCWYSQIEDYIDRVTFDSDFDYKLSVAVNAFKMKTAKKIQKQKGYTAIGAFNGFFYQILSNWKSNIKTSSYRIKRRPSVQCPICGRMVGRLSMEHLQHVKSIKDLPKFLVWSGDIYEVCASPRLYATSWGENTNAKWSHLNNNDTKSFLCCKHRVRWPWKMDDGDSGVMCPFTHKIIKQIDDEYIKSLPNKYSRYADPISWELFIEKYPNTLMQSEVYDLSYIVNDNDGQLQDYIDKNHRINIPSASVDYDKIKCGDIPLAFENAFYIIDNCVEDEVDKEIFKLIAGGHSIEDISNVLGMNRKEIRTRIKLAKNDELRQMLLDTV